jgi:hypothetical protein
MKKLFSYLIAGMLLAGACTENDNVIQNSETPAVEATHRECASMEVLQAQMAADPKLQGRMQNIEEHTRSFIAEGARLVNGKIEIPVVVNVLWRTAAENISDAQIASQIAVLNEDFNATNADVSQTPSVFSAADIDISFVLVNTIRKQTSKRSWSTNDDMKRSSKGGIDPTSPATNLNMWVVNKMTSQGRTILGYAQFPGGPSATDGVVMGYNFFGRVGVLSQPYHLGRTATHEVGHWLNLRHIWGDATCGNDLVTDTPIHNTANYGCPAQPHASTCSGNPREMTMNYMDYTNDACMYMFSPGQKSRSLAVFAGGGPRASFAQ